MGREQKRSDEARNGEDIEEPAVARRNMLRLGGIAAAGAAAAALSTAVNASPADAASGDNLVLGTGNDSGADETNLSSSSTVTLRIDNFKSGGGIALDAAGDGNGTAINAIGGNGVVASCTYQGVSGYSPSGIGVGAFSDTGTALVVGGKATFTRTGVLTIPAGKTLATTAAVPGGLSASSHVLATMQTATAAAIAVKAAVPKAGRITIYLTGKAPAGGVKVAWFVFG
jgi:hypothetical protein